MTLKEELEILRGEPIQVFTGDPMDIPCIETSDAEKLCKNPVVSVHMITYNHEKYIRQAIEGVMMQKTDFEFELVIGEDASTDKTREICFEYQKKYPDKIRVLWWHENLYRNPHPAGGNGARTRAHCRGEFIACCEGDDYWIDSFKLQKQVDIMRKYPNVGVCFARSDVFYHETGKYEKYDNPQGFTGIMRSVEFLWWNAIGRYKSERYPELSQRDTQTAAAMVRMSAYRVGCAKFGEIRQWCLHFGDAIFHQLAAASHDVYFMPDVVSVYRRNLGSVISKYGHLVMRDAICVFAPYFLVTQFGYSKRDMIKYWRKYIFSSWGNVFLVNGYKDLLKIKSYLQMLLQLKSPLLFLKFIGMLIIHKCKDEKYSTYYLFVFPIYRHIKKSIRRRK